MKEKKIRLKKEYRPTTKTLEKVLYYLDRRLHLPLSLDDELYARWKIQREIFMRDVHAFETKKRRFKL